MFTWIVQSNSNEWTANIGYEKWDKRTDVIIISNLHALLCINYIPKQNSSNKNSSSFTQTI